MANFRAGCKKRNKKLLRKLRTDPNAAELLKQTQEDARAGRMSPPGSPDEIDLSNISIASRFGVEQGTREDGSIKVRAIDDESAAGLNPACVPTERLRVHGIDKLIAIIQYFVLTIGCVPHLFKADIDSAYRRIPIRPDHRWAAWLHLASEGASCSVITTP